MTIKNRIMNIENPYRKEFLLLLTLLILTLVNVASAQITQQEKDALIDLYQITKGEEWTKSWDLEKNESTWYGVKIVNNQVVAIDLFRNNVSGVLPESIGDLKHLTQLNLAFNGITGVLPERLTELTKLKILKLEMNRIKGDLPVNIGQLKLLEEFTAFNNFLTGILPVSLGELENLKILNLSSNSLKGQIPNSLGNLSNLESLGLFENAFQGTIPSEMGKLSNLKELVLANNQLGGAIPLEIGQLSSLRILQIQNNKFESINSLKQLNTKELLAFDHDGGDLNFDFKNVNKDRSRMADTKFEDDDVDNK
jgi:Leucine-rich repeat (LRR) protein